MAGRGMEWGVAEAADGPSGLSTAGPPVGPPPVGRTEGAAWRVATRWTLFVFGLLLFVWMTVQLRSVVVQVLLAVILAAGMGPLVDRLTISEQAMQWRWRPPRALVVLVLYLVLIGLLVLL